MGLFDSLKSSLSGNNVLKAYTISETYFCCGFNNYWNVYSAKSRQNGEDACVFILDKKKFTYLQPNERIILFDTLIHGLRVLEQFKHPNILDVSMSISDSKEFIAFASEPITSCLDEIITSKVEIFHESEILFNISQILNALRYIHTNFNMCLGMLSAQNIVVTSSGTWKLTCLDFINQFGNNELIERFKTLSISTDHMLTCMAPETIKENQTIAESDIFATASLMILLFNMDKYEIVTNMKNPKLYKTFCERMQNSKYSYYKNIPRELLPELVSSFSMLPNTRPSIDSFLRNEVFSRLDLVLMQSLHAYPSMCSKEKEEFIELFTKSVSYAAPRILEKKFLPYFIQELVAPSGTLTSLKVLLTITKYVPPHLFQSVIFPKISFTFEDNDYDIKLELLSNFQSMLERLDKRAIQGKLINLLQSGLASRNKDVQSTTLSTLQGCLSNEHISSMASSIYSGLHDCLRRSNTLSVHVNCIIIISELMKYMGNKLDINNLLSSLCTLSSDEIAFLMVILGAITNALRFYKDQIDTKIIAVSLIPLLLRNSQKTGLNFSQVDMHFKVLRKLMESVENQTKDVAKKGQNEGGEYDSLKPKIAIETSRNPKYNDANAEQKLSLDTNNPLDLLRDFSYKKPLLLNNSLDQKDFSIFTASSSNASTNTKTGPNMFNPYSAQTNSNTITSVQPQSNTLTDLNQIKNASIEWGEFTLSPPSTSLTAPSSYNNSCFFSTIQTKPSSKYDALNEISSYNYLRNNTTHDMSSGLLNINQNFGQNIYGQNNSNRRTHVAQNPNINLTDLNIKPSNNNTESAQNFSLNNEFDFLFK